jgi:hypothetical protein
MNSNECAVNEKLKPQVLALVLRQTDYTEEEAKVQLEKYNYNYLELLKDYMGIDKKKENVCATTNQERYRLIREAMDEKEEKYREKKKKEELIKRYQEAMSVNRKISKN